MMEPVISPWIIYAVNLAGKISTIATVIAMILGVGTMYASMEWIIGKSDKAKGIVKKMWIPFAICMAIIIVVPDEKTLMTMIAAQYITPDNISAVQGNIVDFVGQIAQAVKDIK